MNKLTLSRRTDPIGSVFNNPFESLFPTFWALDDIPRSRSWVANWQESDKNYTLEIEAPRFNRDEIKIEVSDGYLVVKGQHKTKNSEYSINRMYSFPPDCNEKVSAKLDRGILTINIEKLEKVKPKSIEVKIE